MIKVLIFSLFLCLFTNYTYADPIINTVSGSFNHNASITISGTGFGTKSPAAPKIWDATDNTSATSMSTHWSGERGPTCGEGSDNDPNASSLITDYWTSYPDLGGTPMTMPHNRITKYIAGGQSSCNGSWTPSMTCNTVGFTTAPGGWNSPKLFAMYYYRVSPTYSKETSPESGDNFKELNANASPGSMYAGSDNYTAFCTSGSPPVLYPNDAEMPAWIAGESRYGCGHVIGMMPNPMGRWLHFEWLWDTSDSKFAFSDNNSRNSVYFGTTGNNINTDGNPPSSITVGGFNRYPRASTTGNYRYWAGLYLDNTYSRVMLGNRSSWASSFVREPQIPSAWNNQSITVKVNLGAFSGNTAYLYVFDANNTCNSTGYPVTIGGGGSATTTVPDTTAPAPPSGLTIE